MVLEKVETHKRGGHLENERVKKMIFLHFYKIERCTLLLEFRLQYNAAILCSKHITLFRVPTKRGEDETVFAAGILLDCKS